MHWLAPSPAVLTFGLPFLAWGALAVAVPVLIHLVLRQRPRRQLLPTMRFLILAHQSATRTQRLKHLLLLACRMAAILLVVGLLMKTGCAPEGGVSPAAGVPLDGPVSAVIAIDDSASMQYRFQGRTRLEDALTWARNLIADPERFPPGSEIAVVTGSTWSLPAVGWTRDFRAAGHYLREVPPAWHDRAVAGLLRRAYGLIPLGTRPRREVYLFTDLTEAAWRESLPEPPKELAQLIVLDAGKSENRNLALSLPDLPTGTLTAGQPGGGRIRVRSGDVSHSATFTLLVDGEVRIRQAVAPSGPYAELPLAFEIPALPEGPHTLRFTLEPDDAASYDNERYACVSVGRVPAVVVVGDEDSDSVATMVAAMIAPPAQPLSERRFVLHRLGGPALPTAPQERPLALILADPSGLTPGGWHSLQGYVSTGGIVVVIPGPAVSASPYAPGRDLLPAEIRGVVTPPDSISLAAADLSQPYLKPFADPIVDSINDRQVFRRLDLGPFVGDSTVVAPFSDRSPAILERRVGAGRVLLLAFSPDREWSQFGTRAAPLIVLLHSVLEAVSPAPDNIDSFVAGRLGTHRWAEPPAAELRLHLPDGTAAALDVAGDTATLPTHAPGHFRMTSASTTQPALIYAVNTGEIESDLVRLTDDHLLSRFPTPGLVQFAHDTARLPARNAGGPKATDWTVPLALSLAGLLWLETLFANRFYRRKAVTPPAKVAGS